MAGFIGGLDIGRILQGQLPKKWYMLWTEISIIWRHLHLTYQD